ncbi:MAG: hypothetical protein ACR2L9_04870 [Solirubrobacteraceae bacterium]
MSVTSPTLKLPPLADELAEVDDPPPAADELLLLLLPQAPSTRASTATLSDARPKRLILPFNGISSHIYGTKLQPYPLPATPWETPNTP